MRRKCTQVLVLLTLLTCIGSSGYAQRSFGVVWNVPESEQKVHRQLDRFLALGIRHIELSEPVSNPVLRRLKADSIAIYLAVPLQFLLPSDFSQKDSLYRHHLKNLIGHYRNYPFVKGVGLFRFGATFSARLSRFLRPFASVLNNQYGYPVYYTTAQTHIDSSLNYFSWTFFHYQPQTEPVWYRYRGIIYDGSFFESPYRELGYILEQTREVPDLPILFTDQWLLSAVDSSPEFASYLKSATEDSVVLYPYTSGQAIATDSFHKNYLVLLLLLVWVIFALHYSYSPIYRRNLFRYFTSHKFFIRDILEWRIRIPDTANILFFQHIFINGIWFYALARHYYSPLGEEALISYFSYLSDITIWPVTLLITGIIIAFAIQTLSVIWLYLLERRLNHLMQSILLYAWPLQLNLIGVTILTPLILSGASGTKLIILTVIFSIIWLGSFNLAAFDISASTPHVKVTYLLGTVLPYSILVIIGISYVFLNTDFPTLLRLIASMS